MTNRNKSLLWFVILLTIIFLLMLYDSHGQTRSDSKSIDKVCTTRDHCIIQQKAYLAIVKGDSLIHLKTDAMTKPASFHVTKISRYKGIDYYQLVPSDTTRTRIFAIAETFASLHNDGRFEIYYFKK